MSISLIVSGLGAVVAAIGAGVLLVRCFRAPRADLVAWLVALLALLAALGAQALGHLSGFTPVTFRTMEVGAQVVAPFALILGLAEVAARSLVVRFTARMFIVALGFIPLVILSVDPLTDQPFTKAWPSATAYYQLIPNDLIEYGLAPFSVLVALIAVGATMIRAARQRPWQAAVLPVTAGWVTVVALAVPGLAALLKVTLPLSSLFAMICLLAAAATGYAGVAAARLNLAGLHRGLARPVSRGEPDDDYPRDYDNQDYGRNGYAAAGHGPAGQEPEGYGPAAYALDDGSPGDDFASYDDGSQGVYRGAGLYRDDPTGSYSLDDLAASGMAPGGTAASGTAASGTAASGAMPGGAVPGGASVAGVAARDPDPAYGPAAGLNGYPGDSAGLLASRPEATREELYGQIAIYTLIEDRVLEFDRLTRRVVRQVRSSEPDTLVYIVHAVPSAPMQRILYEVYRDRAAYDRHGRQPYVSEFEADRRPYVLATNVIELGLQQAKVSPFPSIADLFGEPGYDTSGFERPDYTREYGSSAGQNAAGQNAAGP